MMPVITDDNWGSKWGFWGGGGGFGMGDLGGGLGLGADSLRCKAASPAVPAHVPVNPNCCSKRGGGTWSLFELFWQRSRYNKPSPNCDCPLLNVQGEFEGEHIVIQCPDENDVVSGSKICDPWC